MKLTPPDTRTRYVLAFDIDTRSLDDTGRAKLYKSVEELLSGAGFFRLQESVFWSDPGSLASPELAASSLSTILEFEQLARSCHMFQIVEDHNILQSLREDARLVADGMRRVPK